MSKAEINIESSSEHSEATCCLCFRIDEFKKTEITISENIESIYKSCNQHLNKENLTNDFFKWSYPSPLPFCMTCSVSVRKIHHLNTKLEHLQNRIELFVKSFTKRFLKARRNRTKSSPDGYDLENDKNCEVKESPNDISSRTSISNSADFSSEVEEVLVKQEEEESQEAFSETETANTDFNSLSEDDCNLEQEDDPPEASSPPTSETDSETNTKGNSSRTAHHGRRKRVIQKELNVNLNENRPDKPRRRAAIKAEKSFINWSKDLNDEDDTNKDGRKSNRSKTRSVKRVESLQKLKAAVGLKTKRIKKESQAKQDKEERLKSATDEKEVITNEQVDERKYKCTKCNKTYKSRQHLRDHTLTHDQNKRFHCVPCGVSYAYRRNLRQHNILKHNEKICKYSSKPSGSSDTRSTALPRNRMEKVFVCALCEKSYKTLQNLREHERTHDKDQRFKCTLCDASYAYIRNLRLHLLKHNADKVGTFVLTKSKNTIKNEKGGDGTETVKTKRTFVCKICGKICTTPGQLFYHRQTHKAPEAELKCKLCNKTFKNILNMKKHERVIHQEQNTYLCPVCGKEFRSSTGLKDHYDRHNRDETAEREKFGCTVCSKKFSTKHSLNRHESRHNSEKKFECDICKKKFFTQFEVKNHLVYHKGERAFTCEECGKSFFTKAKLDAHNRIHTGMLFPCEYCHKGFQTTTHLKQHYRSHSRVNEQPKLTSPPVETIVAEVLPPPTFSYACQHCHQFFSSENAIHAHILIAHTQQAFIADFTTFTT